MSRHRYPQTSVSAERELRRALAMTALAVGGVLAASWIADMIARRALEGAGSAGPRVTPEDWMRKAADRLNRGSREILASVDPAG
jgi:hypothetical protein